MPAADLGGYGADDVGFLHDFCTVSYRLRCGHLVRRRPHDPKDPLVSFTTKNVGSVIYCTGCDADRRIVRATFYAVPTDERTATHAR